MLLKLLFLAGLTYKADLPPVHLRVNKTVSVEFVNNANTKDNCGVASKGRFVACASVGGIQMILPNPCLYTDDNYARMVCHELGHTNGWETDHPNKQDN